MSTFLCYQIPARLLWCCSPVILSISSRYTILKFQVNLSSTNIFARNYTISTYSRCLKKSLYEHIMLLKTEFT